jgi:hypothetical protein
MSDAVEIAAEIATLRRGWTGAAEEVAIADLLCGAKGETLVALKRALDAVDGGDGLMNVVWDELQAPGLQERVLAHFASEAASRPRTLRLISDIDDTVVSSLHDARYPRGVGYPAVLALYRAVDRHHLPRDEGEVVFLTARPDVAFGLVERMTLSRLAELGVPRACVIFGALRHLLGIERIAEGKHLNFCAYAELYPESDFVLVGDSGQGDVPFFERALASHPSRVRAAWVHDVVGLPDDRRGQLAERGVEVFDTYLGAAAGAVQRGLIGAGDARELSGVAFAELAGLGLPSDEAHEAREAALRADAARLSAACEGEG